MQINFLNPVLSTCNTVLASMTGLEFKAGKPFTRKSNAAVPGKCVTGLISMQGKVRRASMAVVFSDAVIHNLAKRMLPPGGNQSDSMVIDLVGEISNMLLGRTKGVLEEEGYDFDLALPTMMIGHDYLVPHQTSSPILRIPYTSSDGPFYIEVCFEGSALSKEAIKAVTARKAYQETQSAVENDVELF